MAETIGVALVMVTVVRKDEGKQFIMAGTGLPEDLDRKRKTPICDTVCRYVCDSDSPIMIGNPGKDCRTVLNPLVGREGLRAYLGAPIRASSGAPVGAIPSLT